MSVEGFSETALVKLNAAGQYLRASHRCTWML